MVQLFLTRGDVDVNSKDRGLRSALSYAAENGPSETVWLFLAWGDVDVIQGTKDFDPRSGMPPKTGI